MRHETELTGLAVGDACGAIPADRAIFTPGPARWYALLVTPQREDQAEAWLRLRGVYAFHPVLRRVVMRFGKVREYHRRYLPGYVFARFHGDPLVHRVTASPFITGALCRANDEWGVLEPSRLREIHAMRQIDKDADAARRAARRAIRHVSKGDAVMFRVGPFAEMPGEVVELKAEGGAVVSLVLFGRPHEVTTDAHDLVRIRKSG